MNDVLVSIIAIAFLVVLYVVHTLQKQIKILVRKVYSKEENERATGGLVDIVTSTRRNLVAYLFNTYFDPETVERLKHKPLEYEELLDLFSKFGKSDNLRGDTILTMLSGTGVPIYDFGSSKRIIRLIATVHAALKEKSIGTAFLFSEAEMSELEKKFVMAAFTMHGRETVHFEPKDTDSRSSDIVFSPLFTSEHVYDNYKYLVKQYYVMMAKGGVLSPAAVMMTKSRLDRFKTLKLRSRKTGEVVEFTYTPDVIVGFLTAYAIIEKKSIPASCIGMYAVALHVRDIVIDEKRKETFKSIKGIK